MQLTPAHLPQQLFAAEELQLLVCGEPHMSFAALQASARYEGGFHAEHPLIVELWRIVREELDPKQKRQFLVFCTGSARPPLGGLGRLRLIIQRAEGDTDKVPTAHTCFNVLLLPEYSSAAKLRQKLLVAVANAQGFGLQ